MDTVHECDRQTDRQTDGQTDRITITDTVQTASHGKKFGYFANFSDKNHVKFGHFVKFSYIFSGKNVMPPKVE